MRQSRRPSRAVTGTIFFLAISGLAGAGGAAEVQDPAVTRIEGPQSPYRQGHDGMTFLEVMNHFHVPGVSVAIIKDYKVIWAKGYGVMDADSKEPVDVGTLFQAASISKSLTAATVVMLAQEGKLSLDSDVNSLLKSYRIERNADTGSNPVTLRSLLSHTSGANDGYGFPGYEPGAPLPTLVQVLNGQSPSNVGPVKFSRPPFAAYKYSGGGIVVEQQILEDQTGTPFPEFMQNFLLKPLGMKNSGYFQPLPKELGANAARGHDDAGKRGAAPWHVYPEMAAAGLWTTPTDLARFVIEVQQAIRGPSGKVLTQSAAQQMASPVGVGPFGLGLEVANHGQGWYFSHSGSNWGYRCLMMGHMRKGYGLVIMTNGDNGLDVIDEFVSRVAAAYNWDSLDKPLPR